MKNYNHNFSKAFNYFFIIIQMLQLLYIHVIHVLKIFVEQS